jgi:hypothetical protein
MKWIFQIARQKSYIVLPCLVLLAAFCEQRSVSTAHPMADHETLGAIPTETLTAILAETLTATPATPTPMVTTPQSEGPILWSADFETGDFSQWEGPNGWDGGVFNSGTGIANVTTEIAHSGQESAKLTITTGDGQDHGTRLFRWKESRITTLPALCFSVWYFFPEPYSTPDGWWNVFQWKSKRNPDDSSSNEVVWSLNAHRFSDGGFRFFLTQKYAGKNYVQSNAMIPIARWFQVEACLKKAVDSTGYLVIWQDGVMIFNQHNVQTAFSSDLVWSVNNYSSAILPSPATIYVDDAVISATPIGSKFTDYLAMVAH